MAINSIDDLWEQIILDCRNKEKISEAGLKAWVMDLVPISTDDGVFVLATNNEFAKKSVDGYYKEILKKSCE